MRQFFPGMRLKRHFWLKNLKAFQVSTFFEKIDVFSSKNRCYSFKKIFNFFQNRYMEQNFSGLCLKCYFCLKFCARFQTWFFSEKQEKRWLFRKKILRTSSKSPTVANFFGMRFKMVLMLQNIQ